MDEKAFQRYLATGDYTPSADAAPMSLAAHDRLYHHGLFTGGRCLYRANQSADDPADALLVNAAVPHSPASPHGGSAPTPQGGGNLAAEIADVKSLYTKPDGTHSKSWLRAPNGKPSNLTPDQWCLVRTPTFKKWFGDWEALAKIPVADMESAKSVLKDLMSQNAILSTADGAKLKFASQASKAFSKTAERESDSRAAHWTALANIASILPRARFMYEESPRNGSRDIDAYVKFGAVFTMGDGEDGDQYLAKITSKRYPGVNEHNFYSVESISVEKIVARGIHETISKGQPLDTSDTNRIAKILEESKGVSKIVDSNGEPRLMFHGTNSRFSKFDPKYIRSTNWGKGFYFISSEDDARHYGSIVMPCFLKADNPLDLTTSANDAEYNKWYGKKNSPYDGFYTDIAGKLMCVVPKSSQIFVAPDSPKKSDCLDLRAIADAALAEDSANNSPDGQTAFDQSTPNLN